MLQQPASKYPAFQPIALPDRTWPDAVPAQWRIAPSAFASPDNVGRFTDVAPAMGLNVFASAGAMGRYHCETLAQRLPERYLITTSGAPGALRYGLRMPPARITWDDLTPPPATP